MKSKHAHPDTTTPSQVCPFSSTLIRAAVLPLHLNALRDVRADIPGPSVSSPRCDAAVQERVHLQLADEVAEGAQGKGTDVPPAAELLVRLVHGKVELPLQQRTK